MRKPIYWALLLLCVCTSLPAKEEQKEERVSFARLVADNQSNIAKVSVGMSKQQVLQVMGNKRANKVRNPLKEETFFAKDGSVYEVLYYVIQLKGPFQPIREREMTPVVFKSGKVVGVGFDVLRRAEKE